MESDHHRSGSELFICFTSRNSSSMKISSKSIRSPGRTERFKEPSLSLSSSITRRLRSKNRSMKSSGQASPMFPTGSNKKKGSSFETAEPSSPKVTCIGQVRVKTKKQGQKMRRRSKSRRGEVSFRKTEQIQEGILHHQQQQQQQQECLPHRNQRWVHLPLSICEALRAFGAEFSCLLPCKPSCWRGEKGKNERKIKNGENTFISDSNSSSCRAIFAKWVVTSMEENEEGNERRDMELVREEGIRREKREIVGEIEMQISEEKKRISTNKSMLEEEEEEEEEERRVSICIPPRNALLLMRCRSEPLRMSALANRFWESPIANKEDEDEEEEKQDAVEVEDGEYYKVENFEVVLAEDEEEEEKVEDERIWGSPGKKKEIKEDPEKEEEEEGNQRRPRAGNPEIAEVVVDMQQKEEERIRNEFSLGEFLKEEEEEAPKMKEILERERVVMEVTEERVESRRVSFSSRRVSVSSARTSFHSEEEELVSMTDFGERIEDSTEVVGISENQERERETTQILERETIQIQEEISTTTKEKINNPKNPEEKSRTDNLLPDCLLLMMCEPKLSMEVSKETWVCSTDFIRYRPERKVIQKDGGDEPKKRLSNAKDESKRRLSNAGDESKRRLSNGGDDLKRRLSTDSNPGRPPLPSHHSKNQTPRRSCSKPSTRPEQPAAPPMVVATPDKPSPVVAEEATKAKKLVVYEPLVLTRCKSEPMRSSAKLAPEACCWRDMKLEPQSLGVGATGIGF